MIKRIGIYISIIIIIMSIYTKPNNPEIHFVFLADVSGSMKDVYDKNNLETKSSKIYDLFEDITKDLSSKNNQTIKVSGILFGTKRSQEIADLVSLTDLASRTYNFKKYNGSKELLISLLIAKGAFSVERYMRDSPNEKECNFFFNILKDDPVFCKKIVNSLPPQCKNYNYLIRKIWRKNFKFNNDSPLSFENLINSFIYVIDSVKSAGDSVSDEATYYFYDDEITEEINRQLKKCVRHKIEEPLNLFKWNKNNYESKPAKEVLNSIKILKDNLPKRDNINIMDIFSDYIYSFTPLKKALSKTLEIIKNDSKETIKVIFILSDGLSTDGDPNDLKHLINQQKKTFIVTLYFSSDKVSHPKKIYFQKPYGGVGLEQLYNLASEINPYSPIFDMLKERGWEVDYTKKSKLFIMANNIEVFEEFADILNSFINGNNILGNMISKIQLNEYITYYNKEHRINERQNGGICWCHSLAKVIEYASHRIYRGSYIKEYPYPIFSELRDYLLKEYYSSEHEGKSDYEMSKILDKILPKYFLRYSTYNDNQEKKIKIALMKGRPLVFTFDLNKKQWKNFCDFFDKNRKGVLTKEILNKDIPYSLYKDETDGGHAVILIEFNEDGFVFLNSWGKNFGDNGIFRLKNLNVVENPFIFDVYFYESYLPRELIREWNLYSQQNEKTFRDKYFDEL